MTLATRESLLKSCARRYAMYELADGSQARIQSISERERAAFDMYPLNEDGKLDSSKLQSARQYLVALCLVDDTGKRIFADNELGLIADLDAKVSLPLYEACAAHVGLKDNGVEAAEKNSDCVRDVDSHCA